MYVTHYVLQIPEGTFQTLKPFSLGLGVEGQGMLEGAVYVESSGRASMIRLPKNNLL